MGDKEGSEGFVRSRARARGSGAVVGPVCALGWFDVRRMDRGVRVVARSSRSKLAIGEEGERGEVLRSGVLPSGVVVEPVPALAQFQVVGSARVGIADGAPVIEAECCRR